MNKEPFPAARGAAIVTIHRCVIVAMRGDIEDGDVVAIQSEVANEVDRVRARGVIIDVQSLEIIDTFVGRLLATMAQATALMNARTIVAGMRPEVAMTLVELGMTLPGIETALNADIAFDVITGADHAD